MTVAPHPNARVLRAVYADLMCLDRYASDDIVLHRADRGLEEPGVCRGIEAVRAHHAALLRSTGDTLTMDVHEVVADGCFGAVLAVLRARSPRVIAMPVCGLWRFERGRVVEHWENAYEPRELRRLLTRERR